MMRLKKIKDIIGFNDKVLIVIGVPLVGLFVTSLLFSERFTEIGVTGFLSVCWGIAIFYSTVFWLSFRGVFIYVNTKYPTGEETIKRVLSMIIIVFVAFFILKFVLHYLTGWYFDSLGVPKPNPILEILSALLLCFFILSMYEGLGLYHRLRKAEIEKEVLEKESVLTQLASLKSQVNPHFLFNSLNTLSYLIPESPKRAENFVQKLSKVYRYVLQIKDEKVIPLKDELEFLNSYVFLLKERFGENLKVEIEIEDEHLNDFIIPLSLQLLFENAIKHNEISSNKPLNIKVFINEGGNLVVINNLQKKKMVRQTTKMGLQNIKSRYELLTDKIVEVVEDIKSFKVIVPLLESTQ